MQDASASAAQRSEHGEHGRSEPFTRRREFHAEKSPAGLPSSPAGLPSGERSSSRYKVSSLIDPAVLSFGDVIQLTTVGREDY